MEIQIRQKNFRLQHSPQQGQANDPVKGPCRLDPHTAFSNDLFRSRGLGPPPTLSSPVFYIWCHRWAPTSGLIAIVTEKCGQTELAETRVPNQKHVFVSRGC